MHPSGEHSPRSLPTAFLKFQFDPTSAYSLLVRTTRTRTRTLRDARIVYLAANYGCAVALLESLQALLTTCRRLCV